MILTRKQLANIIAALASQDPILVARCVAMLDEEAKKRTSYTAGATSQTGNNIMSLDKFTGEAFDKYIKGETSRRFNVLIDSQFFNRSLVRDTPFLKQVEEDVGKVYAKFKDQLANGKIDTETALQLSRNELNILRLQYELDDALLTATQNPTDFNKKLDPNATMRWLILLSELRTILKIDPQSKLGKIVNQFIDKYKSLLDDTLQSWVAIHKQPNDKNNIIVMLKTASLLSKVLECCIEAKPLDKYLRSELNIAMQLKKYVDKKLPDEEAKFKAMTIYQMIIEYIRYNNIVSSINVKEQPDKIFDLALFHTSAKMLRASIDEKLKIVLQKPSDTEAKDLEVKFNEYIKKQPNNDSKSTKYLYSVFEKLDASFESVNSKAKTNPNTNSKTKPR